LVLQPLDNEHAASGGVSFRMNFVGIQEDFN